MIGRISSQQIYQGGLNGILNAQAKLSRIQEQLATGKKILTPADDPGGSAQILKLRSELNRVETFQKNTSYAQSALGLEESAIDGAESIMRRARDLAVQGANDSLSASERQFIAAEVGSLKSSLLAIANTRNADGEYIFGGDNVTQAPYEADAAGTITYNRDSGQRDVNIGPSVTVKVSDSGERIFESGTGPDAFDTLTQLEAALLADDAAGVSSMIGSVDNRLEQMSVVRTELGARLNLVDEQNQLNETFDLQVQRTLSSIEDLDYAEAVTALNLQLVALQAAQQTFSKTQNLSLFNYL